MCLVRWPLHHVSHTCVCVCVYRYMWVDWDMEYTYTVPLQVSTTIWFAVYIFFVHWITSAYKNLGAARNLSELVIATVLMYNGQHVAFYQVADFHCTPERFIGVIFRSKMDIPVQQPWIHWLPTPVPFLSFHQPRSTGQSQQILETEKKQHIYQHKCFKTYHLIIYMHQIEYFIHYYCFIIFKKSITQTCVYKCLENVSLTKIEL